MFEAPSVEKVVNFEHVKQLHQMKGGAEFNVLQMVDCGVFFIAAEIPTYFYETDNHCLIYDSGFRDETRPECVGALIDNRKDGAVRLLDASDRKSIKDSRYALSSFYGDKKVFFKQVYRMAPKIGQPEPEKKRKHGGDGGSSDGAKKQCNGLVEQRRRREEIINRFQSMGMWKSALSF